MGHLALRYALAKELVDGGAGVQDSADGAILHKLMQSLQLAITLGERAAGLFLGCRAWARAPRPRGEALAQARAISADHLPHWLHRATAQPTARPAAPP